MTQRIGVVLFLLTAGCSIGAASAEPGDIVINEIAWSGRPENPQAEWIELLNTTSSPITLEGWVLTTSNGAPTILLGGTIEPRSAGDPASGFLLLERGSDDAAPGVPADLIYEGALTDAGEVIYLRDPEGQLIDTANAPPGGVPPPEDAPSTGWAAGMAADTHGTMERIDPLQSDVPGNWATHDTECPTSMRGDCGTPRFENSVFNLPPQPSMTYAPRVPGPGETIRFSAAASSDSNDAIVVYEWDFGDGIAAEGQTPSHAYVESGSFDVVLTVTDSKGDRASVTRRIDVRAISEPLADFSLLPVLGEVPRTGLPIGFIDESSQPSGDILCRDWSFGDGAVAEGSRVAHTYDAPGTYEVILSIADDRGQSAEAAMSLRVHSRRPVAAFHVDPATPNTTQTASFDASSSLDPDGDVVCFLWDFDADGTIDLTSEDPVVEHAFDVSGTHRTTLIVQDESGERSLPAERIFVVNALPMAQFSVSSAVPSELEEIQFTDLSFDSDGEITSWVWTFSDSEVPLEFSLQTSPFHAFQDDGLQTVRLTVRDNRGAEDTAEMTIDVGNLGPSATLTVSPGPEGETGVPFCFDASGSADASPNGSIVTYDWDFDGDGVFEQQSTTPIQSHTYPDDGRPSVTVRVTDDSGVQATSDPLRITVRNRPPSIQSIQWSPRNPLDSEEVTFSAHVVDSDGTIERWRWVFVEDATLEERAPIPDPPAGGLQVVRWLLRQHLAGEDVPPNPNPSPDTFLQIETEEPVVHLECSGLYRVGLIVIDDDGIPSPLVHTEVLVSNTAPIAEFSYEVISGGLVQFDASASYDPSPTGRIVHVAWDFGDGTECPSQPSSCGDRSREAPRHRFLVPGAYTVTLVVIDDEGQIGRQTRQLIVH